MVTNAENDNIVQQQTGWLKKTPLPNHNALLHLLQLLPITQTNASRSRHKKKDRKKNISILLNFG